MNKSYSQEQQDTAIAGRYDAAPNQTTQTAKIETALYRGHLVSLTGARGFYRARCIELGLYREHRTKAGAIQRIKLAIANRRVSP